MRILVLANWGVGERMLSTLAQEPGVEPCAVVTGDPVPGDPWSGGVRRLARELGLAVFSQDKVAFDDLVRLAREFAVDCIFMHAYMRRLPTEVFATPRLGTVNFHASLLPRHRGPAPHKAVLAAGDRRTGLTSHVVTEEYDAGPIIHQQPVDIGLGESLNSLLDKIAALAEPVTRQTVRKLADPSFRPTPQAIRP